ncbi:hypothetical protein COOONC_26034 [Cooperia oncophora]
MPAEEVSHLAPRREPGVPLGLGNRSAIDGFLSLTWQNKFETRAFERELRELHEQKAVSHRDFYNIRKDRYSHSTLQSSIETKAHFATIHQKEDPNRSRYCGTGEGPEPNLFKSRNGRRSCNNKPVTMKEVFKKMGIDAYDLSVDMLDVHADRNTFHRFDKFNTKYGLLNTLLWVSQ